MDTREGSRAGSDVTTAGVRRNRLVLLKVAAVVVVATVALAATVVVPYVVNDLHRLPLSEVASGAHDPKDLWPQGLAGGLLQLAGLLAVVLVLPFAALGAALSGTVLARYVRRPRDVYGAAAGALLLVLAVGVFVGYLSPLGSALTVWRLD